MTTDAEPFPEIETEHRRVYHRELDQLTRDVLRLGAMVTETIPAATEVLLTGDLEAAQRLIDGDDPIDSLAVAVEESCYTILVRQAPRAGELRHVMTVVKTVGELERSADLMVNVAKAARRMHGSTLSPRIRGLLSAMAKEAVKLMRFCLDAYADGDEALARALGDIDDELDQLNRDMVQAIFEAHSAGWIDLQAAVQLAVVARYYERVGDHAVNIGERVTYMVTGWMPEHLGALRVELREQRKAGAAATDEVDEVDDAGDADDQGGGSS